eukprot:6135016-Alexandrium_andersonii.AAC.1
MDYFFNDPQIPEGFTSFDRYAASRRVARAGSWTAGIWTSRGTGWLLFSLPLRAEAPTPSPAQAFRLT